MQLVYVFASASARRDVVARSKKAKTGESGSLVMTIIVMLGFLLGVGRGVCVEYG